MKIKKGEKYKCPWYGVCHILEFIENQVVYKYWSYNKKRWIYKIDSAYEFKTGIEMELYSKK